MGSFVRPKKSLGQHFLKDENIARKIVDSLPKDAVNIIEIGPGMGVLTKYLLELPGKSCFFVDTDRESISYLNDLFPEHTNQFIHADFLNYDSSVLFENQYTVIGNFPYNIGSQIFFKVLEDRDRVTGVVGMIQKEVAERIASGPGSKKYGILSVLLQAFYRIEYLFTVNETVFIPPPKVKSAVIRLTRNERSGLGCDEKLFFQVVKTAFNQRRKTLRNALRPLMANFQSPDFDFFAGKRAEVLSVDEFIKLTLIIQKEKEI
jgi:16S rRNA (adenine1518-N6/adenine1519-N6)-dimethyltransferase